MLNMLLCNTYSNKYSITFSNPKTQSLVGILELHDHLMFFILLIFNIKMIFFIYSIITSRMYLFLGSEEGDNSALEFNKIYINKEIYKFKHATTLEFIWTILPGIILVIMAIPSFMLLYSLEESNFPVFNICVIGNQWYWSYEYMDFDVIHYYERFVDNRFSFFYKDLKESKIYLEGIFDGVKKHDFFKMLVGYEKVYYSDFETDLFFSYWLGSALKNDFFYSTSILNKNCGDDYVWLLSLLEKKNFIDTAHSFYMESAFNFTNLRNVLVDSFFFNSILINLDGAIIMKLSDTFLKDLADRFEDVLTLDCQIVLDYDLPEGYPRLLTTDQVLVIPSETPLRFLVTSNDVIHSWCVPSFGIKMDAIPGRLNQVLLTTPYLGTSWGQCSELCGVNHGFMPIEIRAIPYEDFSPYIKFLIKYYISSFDSRYFTLDLP